VQAHPGGRPPLIHLAMVRPVDRPPRASANGGGRHFTRAAGESLCDSGPNNDRVLKPAPPYSHVSCRECIRLAEWHGIVWPGWTRAEPA
jgi:hypothetical protein